MDRTIAIIGNKKYKAYVNRVGNKIIKIRLFSQKKDDGFSDMDIKKVLSILQRMV